MGGYMNAHEMVKHIKWLGHDGFIIDGLKKIAIDPYKITTDERADLIFVTHEHFDHCSPEDIKKIQHGKTIIITETDSSKKITGDVRTIKSGDAINIDKIKIEAVLAYNVNKNFHPKANGWLGFIIEVDGVRIYHAGDTDLIPEMKDIRTDIALLPVSGTYVMTADEAVKAAKLIKPKIAIPMHYGAIVGDRNDAIRFKEGLNGIVEVMLLD
jgi:L-ascorbate metabolism protein UlaG (beta-lactamase superfamily)